MERTLSTVAALVACMGFVSLATATEAAPGTPPAAGTHTPGKVPPAAIACMKQSEAKKLTGDAAKTFMGACLKAAGVQLPKGTASGGTQPPAPPKK
ncbi:MAG: hypothetical protein HQL74_01345 [Magnetococcales bacterium]|nr:hypothetical protein [Magnetococcales bacterium]